MEGAWIEKGKMGVGDETTTQKWKIMGLTKYGKYPLFVTLPRIVTKGRGGASFVPCPCLVPLSWACCPCNLVSVFGISFSDIVKPVSLPLLLPLREIHQRPIGFL